MVDKLIAVVFPSSGFVAAGFEHSIADLSLIPLAMLLQASGIELPPGGETIGFAGLAGNRFP